ncbi:MAG: hypothetical protein JWO61_61 [Candidatus Saccharibacteria bacterium]|nr:hypothetical protein [Candidatus Saccharibacteria bacterium]
MKKGVFGVPGFISSAVIVRKIEEINDPKGQVLAKLKEALLLVQPQDVGMYRQKMIDEIGVKLHHMKCMKENLYDDRLAGFISKEKYVQKREQLAKQAAELTERLTMLREAQSASKPPKHEPLSDNPRVDLYLRGVSSQKRIVLSILFKQIVIRDGRVILAKQGK